MKAAILSALLCVFAVGAYGQSLNALIVGNWKASCESANPTDPLGSSTRHEEQYLADGSFTTSWVSYTGGACRGKGHDWWKYEGTYQILPNGQLVRDMTKDSGTHRWGFHDVSEVSVSDTHLRRKVLSGYYFNYENGQPVPSATPYPKDNLVFERQ